MKKILKYTIDEYGLDCRRDKIEREQTINMPEDSRILSVGNQNSKVVFWATHSQETPFQSRTFQIFLTGEKVPNNYKYVGTTSFDTLYIRPLVCHLFEVPK